MPSTRKLYHFVRTLIFCLFSMLMLQAEDWTTLDGKTYKNVKVLRSSADTVTILDSEGGASISLANLPPDIQKRFSPGITAVSTISGITVLVQNRPEWTPRLAELSSTLKKIKGEGGTFTVKYTSYNWSDITTLTPGYLLYSQPTGAGKIRAYDLSPILQNKLTLTSEEISKWTAQETSQVHAVAQVAIDEQRQREAQDEVEKARVAAARARDQQRMTQILAEMAKNEKERDEKANQEAAAWDAKQAAEAAAAQDQINLLIPLANASVGQQKTAFLRDIATLQQKIDGYKAICEQKSHDARIKDAEDRWQQDQARRDANGQM